MSLTNKAKEFLIINIGFFICSLGTVNFLVPSKLAAGGVTGIATLLNSITHFPVSSIILALNIPIFTLAFLALGRGYAAKCLYGIFLFPVYLMISENYFTFKNIISFSELTPSFGACLAGGTVGLGIGLAVSVGSNTGGTTILAQIISTYTKLQIGTCLIIIDSIVVVSSIFIFGLSSAILALISLIIIGKVINLVVSFSQKLLISSDDKAFS